MNLCWFASAGKPTFGLHRVIQAELALASQKTKRQIPVAANRRENGGQHQAEVPSPYRWSFIGMAYIPSIRAAIETHSFKASRWAAYSNSYIKHAFETIRGSRIFSSWSADLIHLQNIGSGTEGRGPFYRNLGIRPVRMLNVSQSLTPSPLASPLPVGIGGRLQL